MKMKKEINWNESNFFSATEAGRSMGAAAAKIISQQPGYARGKRMAVLPCKSGGRRLYVEISGKWMDASLENIA